MPQTLKVDPGELVNLAKNLAAAVEQIKGQVPVHFVRAAGGDAISGAGAQRLSKQGAQLANRIIEGLNELADAAYNIGDAGARYSATDAAGAKAIASTGATSAPASGVVTNRVGPPIPTPWLPEPPVTIGVPTGYSDPEWFAIQLEPGQGDQGTSAGAFYGSWWDGYVLGQHPKTDQAVVETTNGARQWETVGTEKVAPLFDLFRTWHNGVVRGDAARLSQRAADYRRAFDAVKNAHPLATTIQDAKLRYQRAIPGTPEHTAATIHLFEVYQQSWRAQQQYRMAIESYVPNDNLGLDPPPAIARPTSAAVDKDIGPQQAGRETGPGGNKTGPGSGGSQPRKGNPVWDVLSGVAKVAPLATQLAQLGQLLRGSPGGTTLPTLPNVTPPPTPGIQDPANSGIPQIPPDLSQVGNPGLNDGPPSDEGLEDLEDLYPPDDYGPGFGGYGGGPGGGLRGGGGDRSSDRGVPLFGTTNSRAPQLPAARPFGVPAAGGRSLAGAGPGGMPFMPYMPGMGGANPNGGGDRKNPFAEEGYIVDAEELRSEVLASATVNEKPPVLPPEATKPTVDKTARNQSGAIA